MGAPKEVSVGSLLLLLLTLFIVLIVLFTSGCVEEEQKPIDCMAICISNSTHPEGWYENCTGKRITLDLCVRKDKRVLSDPLDCPKGIIGYKKCTFGWAQIQSQNGCKRIFCIGDFNLGPHDTLIKGEVYRNS